MYLFKIGNTQHVIKMIKTVRKHIEWKKILPQIAIP